MKSGWKRHDFLDHNTVQNAIYFSPKEMIKNSMPTAATSYVQQQRCSIFSV